jgi:hypothetical protein
MTEWMSEVLRERALELLVQEGSVSPKEGRRLRVLDKAERGC